MYSINLKVKLLIKRSVFVEYWPFKKNCKSICNNNLIEEECFQKLYNIQNNVNKENQSLTWEPE